MTISIYLFVLDYAISLGHVPSRSTFSLSQKNQEVDTERNRLYVDVEKQNRGSRSMVLMLYVPSDNCICP